MKCCCFTRQAEEDQFYEENASASCRLMLGLAWFLHVTNESVCFLASQCLTPIMCPSL